VANELIDLTVKRLDIVTTSAIGTAVIAYLPIMLLGYFAYGSSVHNPVLQSLPENRPVQLAQVCLFFCAVFCYPNQLHPCRRSIMVLFEARQGEPLSYEGEKKFRRIVTTLLLLCSSGIALVVDNLSIVFELIGGIASNTICYLVPTLLYMLLFPRSWKWYAAAFQFGIGCIILPCSVAGVLHTLFYGPFFYAHTSQ
jgi:amino acid permease